MIVEEIIPSSIPLSSLSRNSTIEKILSSIANTCPHFKKAIENPSIIKPINENKYTQVFVEKLNYQLTKANFTFLAGNQYSELFHNVKGIPDFYFYNLEEDSTASALFVVEAKILPSPPPKIREREYVIGDKVKPSGDKECNGGIERFKLEKHGYGIPECALIGFVEKSSFSEWFNKVNGWITDLSLASSNWNTEEKLNKLKIDDDVAYSRSSCVITNTKKVILHHFWINLS